MAPRILLAAGMDWPFAARLAQAFAGMGARVEAVCPAASPLRRSGAPARLHRFSFLRPLGALAAAISQAEPDLVIPCDDLTAELLWRLGAARPGLAPLLERSCGNAAAWTVLASRGAFLRAAREAGAPIAETLALDEEDDVARAVARLGLPLVVKADGSWGGDGVAIAADLAAAKSAFNGFSRASKAMLLLRALKRGEPHLLMRALLPAHLALTPGFSAQRFVPGHPATSAIACWQGRLLAANHFDVVVAAGKEGGTGPATVVARRHDGVLHDAAERIAARFGLSGLYGLDYMRDGEGRAFLLEINPRATPTAHLALGPGHDLVAALLRGAGFAAADRPAVTTKDRIALFPQELRRDPQSSHLAGAYHDLPLDDPALAAALAGRDPALTSFSQAFSGLAGLERAANPHPR